MGAGSNFGMQEVKALFYHVPMGSRYFGLVTKIHFAWSSIKITD